MAELRWAGLGPLYRRMVVRAEGETRVAGFVHALVDRDWHVVPGSEQRIDCDTLCVGYGFVPSVELFRLAGCRFNYDEDLGGPVVERDDFGRTSVAGLFCAGDGTGVRGAAAALDQGRLAAIAVAVDLGRLAKDRAARLAAPLLRRLLARERLRLALGSMYRIGHGLDELSDYDTMVCRCEEVTLRELERAIASSEDPNVVKSFTRVGMGLCQGRNCQRALAVRLSRRYGRPISTYLATATQRPPLRPVPLAALADDSVPDRGLFVDG